jgi:hypothetical protein
VLIPSLGDDIYIIICFMEGNNMACFLVPTAEAIVTTITSKVIEKKEHNNSGENSKNTSNEHVAHVPFSRKLKWLNSMLWGGSALLAFEHVWHGEVTPWFPFLTAAADPEETAVMLHEMSTVGVTMAVLVTAVWIGMVAVSSLIEKRIDSTETDEEKEAAS